MRLNLPWSTYHSDGSIWEPDDGLLGSRSSAQRDLEPRGFLIGSLHLPRTSRRSHQLPSLLRQQPLTLQKPLQTSKVPRVTPSIPNHGGYTRQQGGAQGHGRDLNTYQKLQFSQFPNMATASGTSPMPQVMTFWYWWWWWWWL